MTAAMDEVVVYCVGMFINLFFCAAEIWLTS